jgi:hypothetical protein
MIDVSAEFFRRIHKRGQVPFLRNVSGTLRFDLVNGDRVEPWFVTITKGNVEVSNEGGEADVVARAPKEVFDAITAGESNAMAAVLRGLMVPSGDLGLLMAFTRFFPGPASSRAGIPTAGYARGER